MNNKFIILKIEDGVKYLNKEDKHKLCEIEDKIRIGRVNDGKSPNNKYAVINLDEPYSNEIIEIMKKYGHWED